MLGFTTLHDSRRGADGDGGGGGGVDGSAGGGGSGASSAGEGAAGGDAPDSGLGVDGYLDRESASDGDAEVRGVAPTATRIPASNGHRVKRVWLR